jgi:flotillin
VNTAQAESALSYELQSSKEQQIIISEELGVDLVEKRLGIQVEEQEIIRAERELTATTRLPADADAFKTRTNAEGRRLQKLLIAEGDGQRIRLIGAAEATSIEAVSGF